MIFGSLIKKYVLTPFASGSLLKNDIPQTRTAGLANNRATWSEGFPEITMKPIMKDENDFLTADSGVPASGYDFNGVLNVVSNEIYNQKLLGGAYNDWDTNVVSQYGGYPKGAIVNYPAGNVTSKQQYISLVDNNTSRPDDGTGWNLFQQNPTIGMPDWSRAFWVGGYNWFNWKHTFTEDSWFFFLWRGEWGSDFRLVASGKNLRIGFAYARGTDYGSCMCNCIPARKGDHVYVNRAWGETDISGWVVPMIK